MSVNKDFYIQPNYQFVATKQALQKMLKIMPQIDGDGKIHYVPSCTSMSPQVSIPSTNVKATANICNSNAGGGRDRQILLIGYQSNQVINSGAVLDILSLKVR